MPRDTVSHSYQKVKRKVFLLNTAGNARSQNRSLSPGLCRTWWQEEQRQIKCPADPVTPAFTVASLPIPTPSWMMLFRFDRFADHHLLSVRLIKMSGARQGARKPIADELHVVMLALDVANDVLFINGSPDFLSFTSIFFFFF